MAKTSRRKRGGNWTGSVPGDSAENDSGRDRYLPADLGRLSARLYGFDRCGCIVSCSRLDAEGVSRRSAYTCLHGGSFCPNRCQASHEHPPPCLWDRAALPVGAGMSRIAIIGAGAWGTALSIVLGRNRIHEVRLWAHEKEV